MRKNSRPRSWGSALAGCVVSLTLGQAEAQPTRVIDIALLTPDKPILTRVYGHAGSDGTLGVPVAGGFDMDGDGHADFAVSYMTGDPFDRMTAGEVYLIFGDGTFGYSIDTAAADPRALHIAGAVASEITGDEVWMDDLDGDGRGDLIVCRQNFRLADRIGAGAVTILFGAGALRDMAQSLTTLDLAAIPANIPSLTFIGGHVMDRLGVWARTGDVDGDGIADLVMAADQESPSATHEGAVYVIRGGMHLRQAGLQIDLAGFGATALEGNWARLSPPLGSSQFHFGATCQVADLDGNGRSEVLAAATIDRSGASLGDGAHANAGAGFGNLYIFWDDFFPPQAWPAGLQIVAEQNPSQETVIRGAPPFSKFGEEIAGGLDYDGDQTADLFVGDLIADPDVARNNAGIGWIIFHAALLKGQTFFTNAVPENLTITRIFGPNAGAIGADTVTHGDFDGDGLGDLAFCSPHASPPGRPGAGVIHIFFGQPGPWPELIDTAPQSLPDGNVFRFAEIRAASGGGIGDSPDTLCYSAAAGDIDGDGKTDLITNEMLGNGTAPGVVDVGNLIIIDGNYLGGPRRSGTPAGRPVRPR